MRAGLALVTHPGIASALLEQARAILSDPMPGITVLEVGTCNDETRRRVAAGLDAARGAGGLVIMTDLPGATPANLALKAAGGDCHVLGGLSLAMLIRAWTYRDRPSGELARLALEGGRKALLELQP